MSFASGPHSTDVPHPNWSLIVDSGPRLLCDRLELLLPGGLLVLVQVIVQLIFVPIRRRGRGRRDRDFARLLLFDVDGESGRKCRVLVTCRQWLSTVDGDRNLHEGLEVGRTEEGLVFRLNIQNNLRSPSKGVTSGVGVDLERIARGRRDEGVLNRIRVGRRCGRKRGHMDSGRNKETRVETKTYTSVSVPG